MKKKWFRLDNAALIFPAIRKKNWNNVFRVSATLKEPVNKPVLQHAVDDLKNRFPTFYVRIRPGAFWYYLEEIKQPVRVRKDFAYPTTHMSLSEMRTSCLRVFYFGNRISCEFFHSVTDGTGGMIFLKNLVSRYLTLKYGISVPCENDILSLEEAPKEEEIQDGFLKATGKYGSGRKDEKVYKLRGALDMKYFRCLTTGVVPTDILLAKAHEYGVTLTSFLSAVMAESVMDIQKSLKKEKKWKPVRITIPVNLRKLYGIPTLRNFVLTVNVGVNPKYGEYTLKELCDQMSHQIASEAVPQKMAANIAANVLPAKLPVLRLTPLPLKNMVLRLVYASSGENQGCLNISNLGNVKVPKEMEPYIERFEFIIGVQYSYPNNCSIASFGGNTFINMIRSTKNSELERLFFSKLVALGVPVLIESNHREEEENVLR